MDRTLDDPFAAGRDAFEHHSWQEAYDLLSEADKSGLLSADGLFLLAQAAWWSGRPDTVIEVGERAYGRYLDEGNKSAAAMAAFELARQQAMRGAMPLSQGWFSRAEHLVEDQPDAPVRGYLAWMRGFMANMSGHPEQAIAHFEEALELARVSGDRSVAGLSLHDKGWALCNQGRYAEGLALIDEAMASAVGGEMNPEATGFVYCGMIGICSNRGDYARAAEWTDATMRWCERYHITGFPGICRVHRAEIMRLRGSLPDAEVEARRACEELPRYNYVAGLGYAFYEIGEIRRRMGDFAGAEEAYNRAHEYGQDPQPGLSLLNLAHGNLESASTGARLALASAREPLLRIRLLIAHADIAIATGAVADAATAIEELESLVRDVGTVALKAELSRVRGSLNLARGEVEAAIPDLREALQGWRQIEAPFEMAQVRTLLGRAHAASGDMDGALIELRAARATFEQLGAARAAEQVGALLGEIAGSAPRERATRAFLFTDIVKSTDLVAAIGDEAWEDLLSWHDQTLRSKFASHRGEVANHTGDGFFVAFPDSQSAVEAAVAVQRALAEHRRNTGFAPVVRIGIHRGEATRRGQDYGGGEIHKAARIASQAQGWEILASDETLREVEGFKVGEVRAVELKGVPGPVQVAPVKWR
ncbi:MAG: adenylate/guanylate cyclase domain-containing protein [Acidimicrobiia bacterium]